MYLEYFVLFLIFTLKILLAMSTYIKIYRSTSFRMGAGGSVVVKALRYKLVGPGIDSKR